MNVVTPELIEALEAEFGGEPLCVSGPDPEDLPGTGPQPTSGDGWVLLGYEQGHGPAFETGIATDQQQYLDLWEEVGLDGAAPAVDFTDDIVVWFSEGHGSSCPDLRMDQVIVDVERAQVYPFIVMPGGPIGCTDDLAGAYQFVAAVERKALPEGPFEIGLGGGGGELFRSMQVGVDLSEPGSVVTADDLRSPDGRPATLRSGAVVETIGRSRYTFDVTCGIGYLGVINDTHWVTAEEMPAKWQTRVPEDGELSVTIRLRTEPEPHVRALRNGVEVRYEPAPEAPDGCDAQPASARLTLGSKRARLTSFS